MRPLPGVSEVSVNLMAERLTLRLDQGGADPARSTARVTGTVDGRRVALGKARA
jgi:hypothetical protein